MFTAAVFKELLIPLFDEFKSSFVILPLKFTKECNFKEDMTNLLLNSGLNPEKFSSSVSCLNKNRQNIAAESISSLTDIFHYFIELENISMRFSAKNLACTYFSWSDAFIPDKSETQSSLAFEKSNILYNIAAKLNNETFKNLKVDNIKSSVRDLCISATIFDWISKNFANAPLNDISTDFSQFISSLCLLQAQEMAFFSSLNEEKGLKTLARLSLGIMNLIQPVKIFCSRTQANWLIEKVNEKADLHTFIHCLIMAEFWDDQQLYDIAYDLYSTANRIFYNMNIMNKGGIPDFLKISLLRSEKERQQISYEGKKASESQTKLEPYFMATILDMKSVLKPYLTTYTPLFAQVYPLKIIELQSEFESKALTVIKTLEHASEKVNLDFDILTKNIFSNFDVFILNVRGEALKDKITDLRDELNTIESLMEELEDMNKDPCVKQLYLKNLGVKDLQYNIEKSKTKLENSKIRLVLNDNALIQTLNPLMKGIYSRNVDTMKTDLAFCEDRFKKQHELTEKLKVEIKSTDLRESLLGSDNANAVIDSKINEFDNSAIEILRIIETQKTNIKKIQDLWDYAFIDGVKKICEVIPGANDSYALLKDIKNNLETVKKSILIDLENQINIEYNATLQYKEKLIELLNKY